MCAEGRNAIVMSSVDSRSTAGPIWTLATIAPCVTITIFGSPVAPDVR